MKRSIILSVLATFAIATALFAQSDAKKETSFVGKWVAAKKDGGITRLEITGKGNKLKIQAWGKCHPKDCDWGAVPLNLLGETVSAQELPYGFATWDLKFKVAHMTLRLERNDLVVERYDIYTDDSGRSNYRAASRFKRAAKE
jgi:hypothetical protein